MALVNIDQYLESARTAFTNIQTDSELNTPLADFGCTPANRNSRQLNEPGKSTSMNQLVPGTGQKHLNFPQRTAPCQALRPPPSTNQCLARGKCTSTSHNVLPRARH